MSGRFVTFEGADGSGKSTHLERFAAWLAGRGIPCLATCEPGGTDLGRAVRDIFLGPHPADGVVEALLLFAARRQHLAEVIEPTLAAGCHVLCDRFTDSTFAYQGFGRGAPLEELEALDRVATGCRRPDRTLLFDLPAGAARARGQSASRRAQTGGVNRLDEADLAFYDRVRAGYLELARREPERFRTIDATGDLEATERQVRAALADLFS
jgi:dTMP kinase